MSSLEANLSLASHSLFLSRAKPSPYGEDGVRLAIPGRQRRCEVEAETRVVLTIPRIAQIASSLISREAISGAPPNEQAGTQSNCRRVTSPLLPAAQRQCLR